MGSVSLPQIQAADIGSGVTLKATTTPLWVGGGYDVKTTNKNLNTTFATQDGLKNVNSELAGKANSTDIANQVSTKEVVADNVNATNVNASNLSVSGKAEFNGTDGVSIKDSLNVGGHVEANTINATGAISSTQINGTTVNADKVDTNKLTVGNIDNVEQAITDNKTAADKAQKTADGAQKDATKANYKADAALKVTGNGVLYNHATNLTDGVNQNTTAISDNKAAISANKAAADKAQKTADGAQKDATKANDKADAALKVTGNGVLYNHATNLTDGVNQNKLAADKAQAAADKAQKTADANTDSINALDGRVTTNESNIAKNTTAIANETNDRVAADTVLSNRITENSSAIQSLRHDVSDLGTEIDNVGAISAALAGLHPLDWNGSGSKFQLSAAAGTYDGKQAMALGGFYHPNRNMLLSLGVSSSLGSDRKTAGNVGITFRVGKGSNGTVSDDVAERLAAMDQKISQLESQNQKLTSMLAIVDPSLTKEFPDVPANHWAYEAVSKLAGNGIVEGYPDGDFHGDRTMTRYEMAQVIYKALKKGGTVDQKLVKEFNKEIEAAKANDAQ